MMDRTRTSIDSRKEPSRQIMQLKGVHMAFCVGAGSAFVLLGPGCDRGEPTPKTPSDSSQNTVQREPTPQPPPEKVTPVAPNPAPVVIAPAIQEAGRLCARGQFDAARALASQYASDHPDDGLAEFVIGLTYHEAGNHGPAVEHFQRAIELTPQHVRTHLYFGECLFMLGDLEGARREYEALRAARPQDPEGAYRIGLVDLEEARLSVAEAHFREAISLFDVMARTDPRQFAARRATAARCHARLADVHFARDDYEAARSELIAATTIEPRNISAYFTLSQVYRRLGRDDLAEQAMERYQTAKQQILDAQRTGGGE